MGNVGVLLRPRWLVGHLLVVGLVALFINFGLWQLDRLDSRAERNAFRSERLAAEPVPLRELLARHGDEVEQLEFRRVRAEGRYQPAHELLLRGRSRNGEPGWHVLTPLLQESGRVVLVDRGWVPIRMDEPPLEQATPPEGVITTEGIARVEEDPPEGWWARLAPRDPPEGQLSTAYYIDVDRLAPQIPYPLEPVYLETLSSSPAATYDFPLPAEPPAFERGPHLSYALQWFSFALIGIVGYTLLLWRTVRQGER